MRGSHRSSPRGVTLLELLCVLAMAGLLLAIGVPRVSAELPAIRLAGAARGIAADLQLARARAVAGSARVRVRFALDSGTYRVDLDPGDGFVPQGEPRTLPSGIAFDRSRSTRISGDSISITFQPRGHTADNGTIALAAGSDGRRVIVSRAGRVRIE